MNKVLYDIVRSESAGVVRLRLLSDSVDGDERFDFQISDGRGGFIAGIIAADDDLLRVLAKVCRTMIEREIER